MSSVSFLASYPKSGNTWVRVFLDGYLKGTEPNINALSVVRSDNVKALQDVGLAFDHGPIGAATKHLVALLRLAEVAVFPGIFKTHIANLTIDGIPAFPENWVNRALYIVRDPRDVALSYAKHMGQSLEYTVELMTTDTSWDIGENPFILSSWQNHVRSWMKASFPIALVRYEDLLGNTTETFRQIVQWFGLPLDEDRLQKAIEWADFSKLKAQEEKDGFKERPSKSDSFFHEGRAGRWKEVFGDSPPDFGEDLMKELGYI